MKKYGLSKKKGSKKKRMDDIQRQPEVWSGDEADDIDEAHPPPVSINGKERSSELFGSSSSEENDMEEGGNEVSVMSNYLVQI